MKKQIGINFPQTFQPEGKYISTIIQNAEEINNKSALEISYITGIPQGKNSGKVRPHLFYTDIMGLIDYSTKKGQSNIELTELGGCVVEEDPGLMEPLSLLLCHAMLVRPKQGALLWEKLFMNVLPKYHGNIKLDLAIKELNQLFDSEVTKKNFAPVCDSYSSFGMFGSLNILEVNESLTIHSLEYNPEFIYLYAYILYEYWDDFYPDMDEITSDQLNNIGFANAFGWNETQCYEVLEHLADKNLIRLSRQLMPFTILKLEEKSNLIEELYSELI